MLALLAPRGLTPTVAGDECDLWGSIAEVA